MFKVESKHAFFFQLIMKCFMGHGFSTHFGHLMPAYLLNFMIMWDAVWTNKTNKVQDIIFVLLTSLCPVFFFLTKYPVFMYLCNIWGYSYFPCVQPGTGMDSLNYSYFSWCTCQNIKYQNLKKAESSPHSEFRSRFTCPKHKKKKELIVKDKCFIPLPNRWNSNCPLAPPLFGL